MSGSSDRGAALVLTLMVTALVVGLGSALLLVTSVENAIEANHEEAHGARHAVDAGLACAIAGLRATADWNVALGGAATPPVCLEPAPAWAAARVNVAALTAQLQAAADARYAGVPDTPRWQLWATGGAPTLGRAPGFVVLTWIADDRDDGDGDAGRDDNGHVQVRITAVGRRAGWAAAEALLWRDPAGAGEVTLIGWRAAR